MTTHRQLVVTPSRCIGCRTCEIACAFSHPAGGAPGRSRIRVFPLRPPEGGVPVVCFQCDQAACVAVCPTGALTRDERTGAVAYDEARCIRCRACVHACPFGNMSFDEGASLCAKCDLCGGDPQCAKYCPSGALAFTR